MEVYELGGWMVSPQFWKPDPVLAYRYRRLWQLGESDPELLRRHVSIPINVSGLTPDEVAAGDAWARATFQRYFSLRPPQPESEQRMCSLPPAQGLP